MNLQHKLDAPARLRGDSQPTVSVIVPSYNHAGYLRQRLDSILNQTYQDFEVILLDDKSHDNSMDILKCYENHPKVSHLLINKENSGSTFQQWKKGVLLAQGEFIWIAESDDRADQYFLETLLPYLENDPDAGLVFCQSEIIDVNDNSLGVFKYAPFVSLNEDIGFFKGIDFVKKNMTVCNSIPNASAVLFRRKTFDQVHWTPVHFKLRGDWMLWIKMALLSNVVFINKPLNFFRLHTNNVRSKITYKRDYRELMDVVFFVRNNVEFSNQEKRQHMYILIHYIILLWIPKFTFWEKLQFFADLHKLDAFVSIKILKTYLALSLKG